MEESGRALFDSDSASGGIPIGVKSKTPCVTEETVARGDSVAVSFSKDRLMVNKQTTGDTAHHPVLVPCLVLYADTAHQPGPH
jgi:hypothetical protein